MEIYYNNQLLKNNQFLKVSQTQTEPKIKLNVEPNYFYTLIIHDPDAIGGTYIHWAIINITNNDVKTGNIIMPYKGPSPPPGTGKHRYIFSLYEQSGEENNVDQIEERVIKIENLENMLKVDNPIFETKFISENESGGRKRRKTKRRKINRRKKTRRD